MSKLTASDLSEAWVTAIADGVVQELHPILRSPEPLEYREVPFTVTSLYHVRPWPVLPGPGIRFPEPWMEQNWLRGRDRNLIGLSLALSRWWPRQAKTLGDPRDWCREHEGREAGFHEARAAVLLVAMLEVGRELEDDLLDVPARAFIRRFVGRSRERAASYLGGWYRQRDETTPVLRLDDPMEEGGPPLTEVIPIPPTNPLLAHSSLEYLRILQDASTPRRGEVLRALWETSEAGLSGREQTLAVADRCGLSTSGVSTLRLRIRNDLASYQGKDSPLGDLCNNLGEGETKRSLNTGMEVEGRIWPTQEKD